MNTKEDNTLKYFSKVYLETFTETKSLNKLEENLDKEPRLQYPVASFLFYSRYNKVFKWKNEKLYSLMNEYEESLKEKDVKNKHYKTFLSLKSMENKKNNNEAFKLQVLNEVNDTLLREKMSLNFLLKGTDLKYANVYNFLKKNMLSSLSRERSYFLLKHSRELFSE